MDKVNLEILYNKAENEVIDQYWKNYWAEREEQLVSSNIRPEYMKSVQRQNTYLKVILVGIILIGIITLIFPNIWNILMALAIVLGVVGFIPFTIGLIFFSDTNTLFDHFWYHF